MFFITITREETTMAKVFYLDPIDYLSGKIAKRYRIVYKHMRLSDRRFTSVMGTRTTLPTQSELDARARFAAVSRAVAARRQNLATIATDQAAFVAQKDNPDGKKTFTAYLWSVCGAAYDQNNP